MLPKTAVDKESVDRTELVNVKLPFTGTIAQVKLEIDGYIISSFLN